LLDRPDIGSQIAVREDDAFGCTRCARCIDDRGRGAHVHSRWRRGVKAWPMACVAKLACGKHGDAHLLRGFKQCGELAIQYQCTRLTVVHLRDEVCSLEGRVQRDHHATCQPDAIDHSCKVRTVVHDQCHVLAGSNVHLQLPGDAAGLLPECPV